jgi:hypothetical protein
MHWRNSLIDDCIICVKYRVLLLYWVMIWHLYTYFILDGMISVVIAFAATYWVLSLEFYCVHTTRT